jgi:hypothetical protein
MQSEYSRAGLPALVSGVSAKVVHVEAVNFAGDLRFEAALTRLNAGVLAERLEATPREAATFKPIYFAMVAELNTLTALVALINNSKAKP